MHDDTSLHVHDVLLVLVNRRGLPPHHPQSVRMYSRVTSRCDVLRSKVSRRMRTVAGLVCWERLRWERVLTNGRERRHATARRSAVGGTAESTKTWRRSTRGRWEGRHGTWCACRWERGSEWRSRRLRREAALRRGHTACEWWESCDGISMNPDVSARRDSDELALVDLTHPVARQMAWDS